MTAVDDMNDIEVIEEETEIIAHRGTKLERLEAEGDIAAGYLEELLDIANLGGDIEMDVENERTLVEIITDGEPNRRLRRLVDRHGEVLESLRELIRLTVQTQTGERSRLMLDVTDYRTDRRDELQALVEQKTAQVKGTGEPMHLAPMNPFERKVCCDAAATLGLYPESEGVTLNRYVILSLDEAGDDDADYEAVNAESDS